MSSVHQVFLAVIRRFLKANFKKSIVLSYDMQSVLIGFKYPVMDTLFFYSPKSSYCNLFRGKRTIITRLEQSYGRVPFAGLCRLFISVYVPGAGLPGARASAFPSPHGSEICPDRAAYSAPAIDTHKAQCRWPWPFPPANTQWHWIPRP